MYNAFNQKVKAHFLSDLHDDDDDDDDDDDNLFLGSTRTFSQKNRYNPSTKY